MGISWITVRGVLTHYLSAFASMLCALLLPGEQIELWPPSYVIMIVFSFDEREQGEGNRVKLAGPTSLPEKGRHHVVSPVCTPPPRAPLLVKQSQLPATSAGHHPTKY